MKTIFRYGKTDPRAHILTAIYLTIFAAAIVFMVVFTSWADLYTRALISVIIISLILLLIFSIPRRIVITKEALEIRCIMDITRFGISDIRSIRRLDKSDMKLKTILLGSYGFFGYYGYYVDRSTLELYILYCTEWDNFIEITDINEKRYIISCPDPDNLVAAVTANLSQSQENPQDYI